MVAGYRGTVRAHPGRQVSFAPVRPAIYRRKESPCERRDMATRDSHRALRQRGWWSSIHSHRERRRHVNRV